MAQRCAPTSRRSWRSSSSSMQRTRSGWPALCALAQGWAAAAPAMGLGPPLPLPFQRSSLQTCSSTRAGTSLPCAPRCTWGRRRRRTWLPSRRGRSTCGSWSGGVGTSAPSPPLGLRRPQRLPQLGQQRRVPCWRHTARCAGHVVFSIVRCPSPPPLPC